MEYDKYHSLVNVVDKNINIAFVHRELLVEQAPADILEQVIIQIVRGDKDKVQALLKC